MKQNLTELKAEIHSSTITVGRFIPYFQLWIEQVEDKQGNRRFRQHYIQTRSNKHLQYMSPNSSITFFSQAHTWNSLQGRSYLVHKISFSKLKGIEKCKVFYSNHRGIIIIIIRLYIYIIIDYNY